MAKGRKKPPNGTPGGPFPATHKKDTVTLSAISETDTNENEAEMTENDPPPESLKGVYEEKLKIDVLVAKTPTPVHVRTFATLVLSRLMDSDTSRQILPFYAHHRVGHKALPTPDDLPQKEADLLVYLANPVLKTVPKTKDQQRLSFFVRTRSDMSLKDTKQADGNLDWLKSSNTYVELMDLESTDNERIGMLIGKAPRITSLSDLQDTIRMQLTNSQTDTQKYSTIPPFQLSIDNIGNVQDNTRTRVITFTCSKIHSRHLTDMLQSTFPPSTNHVFLSYTVLYSLPKETQITILQQHKHRTTGKYMLDITIPDFHGLSTPVQINTETTTLRASLGNIRHLDGRLIHLDIDDATKNEDTVMIVAPNDKTRAQQVIGSWIKKHTNQTINWLHSSSFSSDTYRLDTSSRTSAAEFLSAFPTIITTTSKTNESPNSAPTPAPHTNPPTRKPPLRNAWKTLSYSEPETQRKIATHATDTATAATDLSSSASHTMSAVDTADANAFRVRLNDTNDRISLREARQTIENIAQQKFMASVSIRVADLETRLSRVEAAGDAQDKINKATLLTLVTSDTDESKSIITTELGQRINSKIRTRKTEKHTRITNAVLHAKMKLPDELVTLAKRAQIHVKRLKERLDRHMNFCTDDDDDTDSSISTLGLETLDFQDYESDSDAETGTDQATTNVFDGDPTLTPTSTTPDTDGDPDVQAAVQSPSTSHPHTAPDPVYDTSSDTTMHIETSQESMDVPPAMQDTSLARANRPSLQQAATELPPLVPQQSSSDDELWETPPLESFQEWTETVSKSKASHTERNTTRGPPGRLSPPNVPLTQPSTNRYAILQDLPLTRPLLDSQHATQLVLTQASTTHSPESLVSHTGRSPTRRHTRISKLRSQGIPIPSIPSSTPPASPPTRNPAVLAFYAAKRASKGSPTKKKAKKRPSSPSSDEMSTDTNGPPWTWSNGDHTTTRHSPPQTRSNRLLLPPSGNYDSDTDMDQKTLADKKSNPSDQDNTPNISDQHSEERPIQHATPPFSQDNSPSFHDLQGAEYTTVQTYHSPRVSQDAAITNDQDDHSEATTVLASDDETGTHAPNHQHPVDNPSSSLPSSPSTSIQYTSSHAGPEGTDG